MFTEQKKSGLMAHACNSNAGGTFPDQWDILSKKAVKYFFFKE